MYDVSCEVHTTDVCNVICTKIPEAVKNVGIQVKLKPFKTKDVGCLAKLSSDEPCKIVEEIPCKIAEVSCDDEVNVECTLSRAMQDQLERDLHDLQHKN